MKDYTESEAQRDLATVLEQARKDGAVRIRRRDGQSFVLFYEARADSLLDVKGIDLGLSAGELVLFVREGRERDSASG